MHLGLHIKMARISKGLTQEELADKINKTRPLISSIEQTGKVNYFTLQKICEVLNVDLNELQNAVKENKGFYKTRGTAEQSERIKFLEQQIEHLNQIISSQKELIEMYKSQYSVSHKTPIDKDKNH
ncbi:MAG: helix-turn-helix transcriptional regulator [Bacteroidia bacterium]|jgi:transcriptional regulator with XRE-family HTH domain|nr:helix-turn-helix transcriptional regulator [Bacteroidia bacterium]